MGFDLVRKKENATVDRLKTKLVNYSCYLDLIPTTIIIYVFSFYPN